MKGSMHNREEERHFTSNTREETIDVTPIYKRMHSTSMGLLEKNLRSLLV